MFLIFLFDIIYTITIVKCKMMNVKFILSKKIIYLVLLY